MGKKQKQHLKEQLKSDKLNSLTYAAKNPSKYSLVIALLWILVIFVISIIGFFVNNRGYLWNLDAGSIIVLIISLIWAMIKIGVGESALYKFQKYRDDKFALKYKVKIEKLTKNEFTKRREAKPWIGMIFLFSISLTIFLITLIIQLV